jgi:hypothetical protein
MPDFERLVANGLARLDLTPVEQRAVIAELSAHLEEFYCARVAAGSADPEGETMAQVASWNQLRRRIQRAKEHRMRLARTVVLPGLGAVIWAWITFRLSVFYLVQPVVCQPEINFPSRIVDVTHSVCSIVAANSPLYFGWLATLPFAGALAAALARRAGARPAERLAAALFPAVALAAETTAVGLLSGLFWRVPIYWVLAPAMVCALGALPFLRGRGNAVAPPIAASQA